MKRAAVVVRIARQRGAITVDRVGGATLAQQQVAQVGGGHRKAGPERERAPQRRLGLGGAAGGAQHHAEIGVEVGAVGHERDRLADQAGRRHVIALAVPAHPEFVQRLGDRRRAGQQPTVPGLGLGEPAGDHVGARRRELADQRLGGGRAAGRGVGATGGPWCRARWRGEFFIGFGRHTP